MSEAERHDARRNWLKASDVAEMCGGVCVSSVYAWIASGELQAWDAARTGAKRCDWRFKPEWVEAFKSLRMKNAKAA